VNTAHTQPGADRRLGVVHVDMDAFYVSVEVQADPTLRGKPVIVGGTGDRGVVAAASYEARAHGVRSAMPTAVARRRCPDAIFLHGDHDRYAEVSAHLHEIFGTYTPVIEPIALDEAFLDIRGAFRLFGAGVELGHTLRSHVFNELGLTCSVGVARNKLLAKMASEAAKPVADVRGTRPGLGVVAVPIDNELDFLQQHPIRALWGVGPKTHEKLMSLGIATIGDLSRVPIGALTASIGANSARHLQQLSMGIDDRPVVASRAAKSIGHEETFSVDHHDVDTLHAVLVKLADAVAARIRRAALAASTVQLKIRFGDFHTITRSITPGDELTTSPQIVRAALKLLREPALVEAITDRGVRLLGVSAANLAEPVGRQLSFDDQLSTHPSARGHSTASDNDWSDVTEALDNIRDRFGDAAIMPGRMMSQGGRGPGRQLWGPEDKK
jgi:DNA polymerase IV